MRRGSSTPPSASPSSRERGRRRRDGPDRCRRDAAHDQPLDAEVVDQRLRRHRRVDHADAAEDDDDAVAAQRAGGEAVAVDRPGARAARLLDEDRRLLAERRDDADARRAFAEAGAGAAAARLWPSSSDTSASRRRKGVIDLPRACACKRSSCRQRGQRGRRGLLQRPVDVLANEGARLFAARLQRGDDRRSPLAASALPSATARLRCQRSKPMRRIALPSVSRRKSSSRQAQRSSSRGASSAGRTSKSAIGLAVANLFHGQTSWQSSQP